jgi:hypothetical protein
MLRTTFRTAATLARTSLVLTLALGSLAACTAKPTGYSDFDLNTDFSKFRTFAFMPDKTLIVASPDPVNPALEPTLKEETRKVLTRKGFEYAENPEDADFLVGFAIGQTPTARTTAFTSNQRQVYIVGEGQQNQVVTQQGTEAGLVIDLLEQSSGEKKWMGWAIDEITMGDMKRLRVTVNEIVGVILKHFPPDIPAQ